MTRGTAMREGGGRIPGAWVTAIPVAVLVLIGTVVAGGPVALLEVLQDTAGDAVKVLWTAIARIF